MESIPNGKDIANSLHTDTTAQDNRIVPAGSAAYHGLAGAIVRAIEPHTEADPIALLVQLLVAFGNLIRRGPHLRLDGAFHYLNLFVVLVGISSKGRKGTSWAHTERVSRLVDNTWATTRVQGGLSSGEGLIWAVRDPIMKMEAKRDKGKLTGEYIKFMDDPGVEDKRLMVSESEFGGVLRVLGREGNTLSAIIRAAWDTGNLRTLTKNNPAHATGAHISIVGHITAEELRRYLGDTETSNGFGNRFLWVSVTRSKLLPDGGGEIDYADLAARLNEAVAFALRVGEMRRDEEARDLWHAVYPALSAGKPGLVGSLTGRAEAQTMRLAAIYALLDLSSIIRIEHLKAALALWYYCERSVEFIFGDAIGDPVADAILQALRRIYPAGLTLTDISYGLFNKNQKAARLNAALTVLRDAGKAHCVPESTPGRTAERWFAVMGESDEPQIVSQLHSTAPDSSYDKNGINGISAAVSETSIVNPVNIVSPAALPALTPTAESTPQSGIRNGNREGF